MLSCLVFSYLFGPLVLRIPAKARMGGAWAPSITPFTETGGPAHRRSPGPPQSEGLFGHQAAEHHFPPLLW